MARKSWQDWILVACAAWLFVSPFVLGFAALDQPAAWVATVLAVFLFASAAEALVLPDTIEDWLDIAIGFALMGAPWIFEFREQAGPALSFLATGFVVTVCAIADLGRDMRDEAVRHRAAHG